MLPPILHSDHPETHDYKKIIKEADIPSNNEKYLKATIRPLL